MSTTYHWCGASRGAAAQTCNCTVMKILETCEGKMAILGCDLVVPI